MTIFDLEKNLLDINNDSIPEEIMSEFWKLKNNIGSAPMGISKIEDTFFIISPAFENFILFSKKLN